MTQVQPTDQWYYDQTFGITFQSPTGNLADATRYRKGTDGNYTYQTVSGGTVTDEVTPPITTPLTGEQQSAKTILQAALDQYGLGSLGEWAWTKWQAGETLDQIMLELRDTPEYATRFPAMKDLGKAGRSISEGEYINLENAYIQLGRQFGLPSGFYDDPSDFTKLITGQVSPSEYQTRLQDYQAVAYDTDPNVRAELQRLYGIDAGHIAAFFIDPDRALPIIQRQFGATMAAAAADTSGYGQLGLDQAEMISGVSQDALRQGFGALVQNREVFSVLPGEAGSGVDTGTQLSAAFMGNAAAQQDIENRARRRAAVFGGGGGSQQTQRGYAGVG